MSACNDSISPSYEKEHAMHRITPHSVLHPPTITATEIPPSLVHLVTKRPDASIRESQRTRPGPPRRQGDQHRWTVG